MSMEKAFDHVTSDFRALLPGEIHRFKRQSLESKRVKRNKVVCAIFSELHTISRFIYKVVYEIGKFIADIRKAQLILARYEELSWLLDSELACRGLSRRDIPQIAIDGRKEIGSNGHAIARGRVR